ncbi:MAG: thiamine pyrophosphate-dependent enzyme [Deltaproteobacteria bacterium]|nr:thiamine pyrophosphate-dependent enzyme [Deltaproteobacteria bacterium]
MRSADVGIRKDRAETTDQETSLEMYRSICRSRFFDQEVVKAVQDRRVIYPVYLSLGQEAVSAALASAVSDYMLFTQHRCHAYYLAFGGPPEKLRDELLGLPSGTSGGRAGSNCLQCHEEKLTMFGHHGLIGENVPQAVGAALGSGKEVLCVVGDGAAEEDYIYPSLGFAVTHRLPVLFICDDNDLSILTPTSTRRSWKISDVAKGIGMPAVDITDDPWTILSTAQELRTSLPALINVYSCRMNWHVGVGTDGPPEWDRFSLVTQRLAELGLSTQSERIQREEQVAMEQLWAR